jgi:hypothetical protein
MNQQLKFTSYIGRPFLEKEIKIQVLNYGFFATCNYLTTRIRLYLDINNIIERMNIGQYINFSITSLQLKGSLIFSINSFSKSNFSK